MNPPHDRQDLPVSQKTEKTKPPLRTTTGYAVSDFLIKLANDGSISSPLICQASYHALIYAYMRKNNDKFLDWVSLK
jgi:hypothetical protein